MQLWQGKPKHLRTGACGESAAAWYLRLKGYRILHRNFLCRAGEIDIVAAKGNTIVFVEVRTRTSGSLLHPLETVDPVKVFRTLRAAMTYLKFSPEPLPSCRFDIVAVAAGKRFPVRGILHVKNAYDTTSGEYIEGRERAVSRRRRSFTGKRGGGRKG